MKFRDTKYYLIIINLYERITEINEPYDLDVTHSEIWLDCFSKFVDATQKVSIVMWPNLSIDNDIYLYEKTALSILRNYKAEKGSFEKYYITSLRNNVYRLDRDRRLKRLDETRNFHIPVRTQRKINRFLAIVKKYNKTHLGSESVTIYDEKMKKVFLERNIVKDEQELNKILLLNYESLDVKQLKTKIPEFYVSDNQTVIEQAEENISGNKIFSKNKFVNILDILEGLPDLFSFVDKCYESKIHLKQQNSDAQTKKEIFLREVLTCYYYSKYKKLADKESISDEKILIPFKGRKFVSRKILKIFIDNDNKLVELARSNDKQKMEEFSRLNRTAPVTLESISIAAGKKSNYGSRVLGDFKKYMKNKAVSENLPEEIVQLI